MNYESLLDEIMVNTLSAKELIGTPQIPLKYAVCPWHLEFHTSIFLASILLALDQGKPLIFLIQCEELESDCLCYQGTIWPHFGRAWESKKATEKLIGTETIRGTESSPYPYLDKLFSYLAVINPHPEHLVLFIKKGAPQAELTPLLKKLLEQDYGLVVLSNCYEGLPLESCKKQSSTLLSHLEKKTMNADESHDFPAFKLLSDLLPQKNRNLRIEHHLNTGEIGFSTEQTTSFWFMLQ